MKKLILLIFGFSVVNLCAQEIRRVTATRDLYPDWSPDGSKIVFQSDRNSGIGQGFHLYIIGVDQTGLIQLTAGEESDQGAVWSPDGKHILYSSYLTDENSELFMIDLDGTNKKRLTYSPARDGHAKFSPDGNSIIFNSRRDEPGGYEIYEMDIQSGETNRLTVFEGWDTYPDISPNGEKIIWRRVLPTGGNSQSGRNSEVFMMDRDGSNVKNLTSHPAFDGYPSWSPDGEKIIFASNRNDQSGTGDNFHIYIMDKDGTLVTRILENESFVEDARPRWSPDGTKILFNRQYVANESSADILIYELPESLQINLTSDR